MAHPHLETTIGALKQFTTELADEIAGFDIVAKAKTMARSLGAGRFHWPTLTIGSRTAPVPVVQGGMGVGISLSRLAVATAKEGGIGVIAANGIGLLEKDYYEDGRAANLRAFRREIQTAKSRTDGIIGVNIMVAVNDFHQLLDVAIEEKADIVFMGAGLPIKNIPVERMRGSGVSAVPIVSSVRATEMIFRMWKKIYNDVPDAVVFEGPLAGGHLGFTAEQIDDPEFQLEAIVPGIVEALKPFEAEFNRPIPVIAGGGVYTGEDAYKVLQLGAAGVQMGTRFVATDECDADQRFKEAYVSSTADDIGLIHSPVGMPGRAIRNKFIVDAEEGRRPAFRCAWQCLSSCKADDANYCISIALNNARKGNLKGGFVFAGANAYRVKEIVPVAALMEELTTEFRLAAQAAVAQRLEGQVTTLGELRQRYTALKTRATELKKAYDEALATRIQDTRDAYDNGMIRLRKQYDDTLGRLRNTQFLLLEGLAESWRLLSAPLSILNTEGFTQP